MSREEFYSGKYDAYEDEVNAAYGNRHVRRKHKAHHKSRRSQDEILAALVEDREGLEGGFDPTYQPSRYEREWLLSSLQTFYEQALITDVEALVKGGKEASVYRCTAHPSTGLRWIAAKVYRPRKFRSIRNDADYRRGRTVLTADGHAVHENQDRVMRALGKKTAFGVQVAHTSWLMHEYTTLAALHKAGGAVPRPVAVAENAILMAYYGDDRMAAPLLNEVRLHPDEVEPLFRKVLHNVALMLDEGMVHGDLSAYNVLYWDGDLVLIDFPQVVALYGNDGAQEIFRRDVERICDYFAGQGRACDAERIARELWSAHTDVRVADPEAILFNQMMADAELD